MMKVTSRTIKLCKEANENTKYIVYFPGNDEDVNCHKPEDWSWCDENTVIDLCNYPYHSELHNFDKIGFSKVNLRSYKIGIFLGAVLFSIPIALLVSSTISTPILVISSLVAIGIILGLHKAENYINNNYFVDVISDIRFYTRGRDPVAVGVKRVLNLLESGVHPNNIILSGYSIGGGVGARVHKIFEDQGIYLRCQINSSFSSTNNAVTSILRHENNLTKYGTKFLLLIKGILIKVFDWNIETYKTINSITPYTMFFNNEGDQLIRENAQLVTKVREMEKNGKKQSNQTAEDRIFELLFKKHIMLKPNAECQRRLQDNENNTHCFPMDWLESAECSRVSAEDLHYLFTYLPYHMDLLRSRVNNLPGNNSGYSSAGNNNKMVKAIDALLGALNNRELDDLKSLLNELEEGAVLNKNQGYSQENFKKKFDKLNKWTKKYNISFIDLDYPKSYVSENFVSSQSSSRFT